MLQTQTINPPDPIFPVMVMHDLIERERDKEDYPNILEDFKSIYEFDTAEELEAAVSGERRFL
jgi:hypothetical protein